MTREAATIDLRTGDLPWRLMTIPDSTPDVSLCRLHVEPRTKASVAVVRFPPGWARAGVGHYRCAEQFVVLSGRLEVSGIVYVEGEYGYLPARAARSASRAPGGCLAVAWFSGPPAWAAGPALAAPAEPALHGRVGDPPGGVGGGAEGRDRAPAAPVEATTELLWSESGRWCLLPSGATPPSIPGPVLIRRWH
jgi:hypothetical protein